MLSKEEMINELNLSRGNEADNRAIANTWDMEKLSIFHNLCKYCGDKRSPWEWEMKICEAILPVDRIAEIYYKVSEDLPTVTVIARSRDNEGAIVPSSIYTIAHMVVGEITDWDIARLQNAYEILSTKYGIYPSKVIIGGTMSASAAKYISTYKIKLSVYLKKKEDWSNWNLDDVCLSAPAPIKIEGKPKRGTYLCGVRVSKLTAKFIKVCNELATEDLDEENILTLFDNVLGYALCDKQNERAYILGCLESNRVSADENAPISEDEVLTEWETVFDVQMSTWTTEFLKNCISMSLEELTDKKKLELMNYAFNNCEVQKELEKNLRQYAKYGMDTYGIEHGE